MVVSPESFVHLQVSEGLKAASQLHEVPPFLLATRVGRLYLVRSFCGDDRANPGAVRPLF